MNINYKKYLLCLASVLIVGLGYLFSEGTVLSLTRVTVAKPFAVSLIGTEPDGSVRLTSQGTLLIDHRLRAYFDYYLSTLGERDLNAIRLAIGTELVRTLPEALVIQAHGLFERYVRFKVALANFARLQSTQPVVSMAEHLRSVALLRMYFFSSDEINGFFGQEDRYHQYIVDRLRVLEDKTLDTHAKEQQLVALQASLPMDVQNVHRKAVQHLSLAAAELVLRQQGGGESELYRLRTQQVGPEAAERLMQLDQQETAWQQRVESYQRQRQAILSRSDQTSVDQAQALETLARVHFSALERRRLSAYLPQDNAMSG
jgi:lipase chaperone LimK